MRPIAASAITELESGAVALRSAIFFEAGGGYGFWDDIYPITIDGRAHQGAARAFRITPLPSVADGSVQGVDVTFSGVDPGVNVWLSSNVWHQSPVTIRRLIMSPVTLAVLDAQAWFSGFVDTAYTSRVAGGHVELVVSCESTSRDHGRRGTATRTEASQRRIAANDGFFKHVARMRALQIYWGRNPPRPPQGVGALPSMRPVPTGGAS